MTGLKILLSAAMVCCVSGRCVSLDYAECGEVGGQVVAAADCAEANCTVASTTTTTTTLDDGEAGQ